MKTVNKLDTPFMNTSWWSALHWNLQTCRMGVAIQRPDRRIGSRWAGLRERAPIFACQIPLRWLIKDQQADPTVILSLKTRQKSAASRGANLKPDKDSNRQFFQFSSLKTRAHYGDKPF